MSAAFEADITAFRKERGLGPDQRFLSDTSLYEYVRHVRKWHEATGLDTPNLRACRGYVIELAETSPTQAQYAYRALKRYSAWLSAQFNEADPLASWKMNLTPEPVKTPVATQADVDALLKACEDDSWSGVRDHAIISVLAYTGMRRSEVARMKWEDVDIALGTITIPKTKAKRPRTVQMPSAAQKSLRRYMRSQTRNGWTLPDHVWHSRKGGSVTGNGIGQILERRGEMAGVKVPAHSLRRFYAVTWLDRGGSQVYLQKQAGWKDGRMVARYVSTVAERESSKEALRLFG